MENVPEYAISAASRMALIPIIGRDGVAAFDRMLVRLRAGEGPKADDFQAFARSLHDAGLIDFSTWPEFKGRTFGGGFPVRMGSYNPKR
jgi:hypothetical protein